MAQQKGTLVENTFAQGLFTEASALNFPKDAASDCLNVMFNQDGTVSRRPAIGYEANNIDVATVFQNSVTQFTWKNVANVPDVQFAVYQIGSVVTFLNVSAAPQSLSQTYLWALDLNGLKLAGSPDAGTARCQFAEGNGKLFIAHPFCDPINITWNGGNSFTAAQQQIVVRDLDGVIDGYTNEQRTTTVTVLHLYNLYNQGWYTAAPTGNSKDQIGTTNPVLPYFVTASGTYAANCDYWWSMKDSLGQMNNNYFAAKALGNSPAPKGHFLVNAFYTDRATSSNLVADLHQYNYLGSISDLSIVSSSFYRPSVICFYAGRVFYTGVNYNNGLVNYGNRIYFSRIIERPEHIGQCYQDNDPTAEDGSDLLPSDGGVIVSPEIGTIYKLLPMGYSLIVFASNGIWSISGSTGVGFSAKDYTIAKISTQGVLSECSFIDFDGTPVWWTTTGIFALSSSGAADSSSSVGLNVQSISDTSIKTFYRNIPAISKYYVQGTYNRDQNLIYWLYNSGPSNNPFLYTDVLTFNTNTKAFSHYSITNGFPVFNIATYQIKGYPAYTKLALLSSSTGFTFGEFNRTDYLDYGSFDYLSYVETGHSVQGHAIAKFWTPYVFVYISGTPSNTINFYHKWDFTDDPTSGKYSTPQVVYAKPYQDYQTIRRKMRGSGKAVKMRFESSTGKPFDLQGWAMTVSSNSGP